MFIHDCLVQTDDYRSGIVVELEGEKCFILLLPDLLTSIRKNMYKPQKLRDSIIMGIIDNITEGLTLEQRNATLAFLAEEEVRKAELKKSPMFSRFAECYDIDTLLKEDKDFANQVKGRSLYYKNQNKNKSSAYMNEKEEEKKMRNLTDKRKFVDISVGDIKDSNIPAELAQQCIKEGIITPNLLSDMYDVIDCWGYCYNR